MASYRPDMTDDEVLALFPNGDKEEILRVHHGIHPEGWDNGKSFSVAEGDGGGTTDGKGKWYPKKITGSV